MKEKLIKYCYEFSSGYFQICLTFLIAYGLTNLINYQPLPFKGLLFISIFTGILCIILLIIKSLVYILYVTYNNFKKK